METPVAPITRASAIPQVVWMIALLALLLRLALAFATHFTSEDYMITLRYAENIAHGQGFVYNAGERVLGSTTPLYTLFLALVARLGLNPTPAGKALNILADALLCVVMYRWLCQAGQEVAGKVAAFWVAVNPIHLRWAISGMETGVVTLCGAWVWLAYAQRRYLAAYAMLAVLFLLRWDTALMTVVLTAAILGRERRFPFKELGLFLLLIAPWLLFATWYFGSPIPVTGAAKMTVYGWRSSGTLMPQFHSLLYHLNGTLLYDGITLLSLVGLYRVWRERWTIYWPPLAWFGLYWAAFLVSKILLFEWYLVPSLPVYGVLVSIGIVTVAQGFSARWPQGLQTALIWGAMSLITIYLTGAMFLDCRERQSIEDNLRMPIGLWLRAHSKPGDRIMLEPIGYIGYYSRRPILDTVGLVSPGVLPYWSPSHAAPMLDIALAFRPEWCVLRPGELGHIQGVAQAMGLRWEDYYEPVKTFRYTPRPERDWIIFTLFHRK